MATPQSLLAEGACVRCYGATLFETFEIVALKNILTGLGVTMTQEEINGESSCYVCQGLSLAEANIVVLLNEISAEIAGGGTGTGGAGVVGAGSPEGVVVAPPGTSYYDTVGLAFWYKLTGVGAVGWHQVV